MLNRPRVLLARLSYSVETFLFNQSGNCPLRMHPMSWPRNDLVTDMAYPMECLSQGINAQAVLRVTHTKYRAGRRAERMRKSLCVLPPNLGTGHRSHG
ncbi:hypothetical protein F5Y02DRAFT_257450 [Annulohypoxylon stygium]|nr:hypothetical protein F5Y02DRAFT_257450 [Annulohypoxylon stygium]